MRCLVDSLSSSGRDIAKSSFCWDQSVPKRVEHDIQFLALPVSDERNPVLLFFSRLDPLRKSSFEVIDDDWSILFDELRREFGQDVQEAHVARQILSRIDLACKFNSPFVKFTDSIASSVSIEAERQSESTGKFLIFPLGRLFF